MKPSQKAKAAGASSGFHIGSDLLLMVWFCPSLYVSPFMARYRNQIDIARIHSRAVTSIFPAITDDFNTRSVSIEDVRRAIPCAESGETH